MPEMSVITVELPDGFALVANSAEEVVKTLAGLDWDYPDRPEQYMQHVSERYSLTGNRLLFWDFLSFLEACHNARILILTIGGEKID